MLGLPKSTELNKHLSKNLIYEKFQMTSAEKAKIDEDISKITIIHEISPTRVNIGDGENIKGIFVLLVTLKRKDFSEKSIIKISKLIPQNIIFLLEYEDKAKLAVYHVNFMQTQWQEKNSFSIKLNGLTMDDVWENIIAQIGGIKIEKDNTLDEQIDIDNQRAKLKKEIAKLEKLARSEQQPKKKFELVQKIKGLKNEYISEMGN
jgi:hypothetical protein